MRQESGPGEAAGGGGARAWLGSLRAVKRQPAIVRRRPGCAAGLAPGAEVGRGQHWGLGGGGDRFPLFQPELSRETRGRRGPGGAAESPTSGCQKNITVNWGQYVCPPRKNAVFEDANPLKLKSVLAAKSRTLARETLPGDGRRNAGKT